MIPQVTQVDKTKVVDFEKTSFFQSSKSGGFLLGGGMRLPIFEEFVVIRLGQLVRWHIEPPLYIN